mgnify:CR=1 FL=1
MQRTMKVQKNGKVRKKKEKYRRLRAFCAAFTLTLSLLMLGAGFLVADYNTRRIGFGSGSLRLDVSTQEGRILLSLFGREKAVTLSREVQEWVGKVWTLAPAGWKAEVWLLQGEREAAPALLEWVGADTEE